MDGQQELEPEAHIVCVLLILNCLNWGLPSQGFSGKLMIHRFLGKTKKRGSALPGLVAWICVTPRYLRRTQKRDLTYKIEHIGPI